MTYAMSVHDIPTPPFPLTLIVYSRADAFSWSLSEWRGVVGGATTKDTLSGSVLDHKDMGEEVFTRENHRVEGAMILPENMAAGETKLIVP